MNNNTQYIPKYENKVEYIVNKIKHINKIKILELGVSKGVSTKKFIKLCELNDGFLTSVDIEDCSKVAISEKWNFIHSSDDNFNLIDQQLSKDLDFIFIDSFHEPSHVEKVFYHYYDFLKKEGICIIDDISWLPYTKNEYRDNSSNEYTNRKTFQKILEIYNSNKEGSGLAIITKKKNYLDKIKKIPSREYSLKSLIRGIFKITPKK